MSTWLRKASEPTHERGDQLKMGREVEKEHAPTVSKIIASVKDGAVGMSTEEIYESIAQDHLNEIPDYYTRLKKMEDEAKMNKQSWLKR